jgi:hypothetical protein
MAKAEATIKIDKNGIRSLARDPKMQEFTKRIAEEIQHEAEALVVSEGLVDTGKLKDSFKVVPFRGPLYGYSMYSTDFIMPFIEYGTEPHGTHPGTKAYHIMLKAVERVKNK